MIDHMKDTEIRVIKPLDLQRGGLPIPKQKKENVAVVAPIVSKPTKKEKKEKKKSSSTFFAGILAFFAKINWKKIGKLLLLLLAICAVIAIIYGCVMLIKNMPKNNESPAETNVVVSDSIQQEITTTDTTTLINDSLTVAVTTNDSVATTDTIATTEAEQKVETTDTVETIKSNYVHYKSKSSHTVLSDTLVNKVRLRIMIPSKSRAIIKLGSQVKKDYSVALVAQATEWSGNSFASQFVYKGEKQNSLKGYRNGYCLILDGRVTIGHGGYNIDKLKYNQNAYFFRQHSLVRRGKSVASKDSPVIKRRALCKINGKIGVIESYSPVSMFDFAQALIDAGVRDAIALSSGDQAFCMAFTDKEYRYEVGVRAPRGSAKVENYIVWE